MADDAARSRLGRGLAALIGDVGAESQAPSALAQPAQGADRIRARQSAQSAQAVFRRRADELADSIRERGIIQPIVVRARGADSYEIIAGERRWRAAQRAGLHEVPIVVLDVSDGEALELAIIENVQRTDLNPLEEATGYQVARRPSSIIRRTTSPRSSARAAATSPTRCGCCKLPER